MYLLAIFLPLFGALITSFFGKFIGAYGTQIISIGCIFISVICAFFIGYEVILNESPCYILFNSWIALPTLNIYWGLLYDMLSAILLIVVLIISLLVHIYSIDYMQEDPHIVRFMSYLSLFTFFMLLLISSDNFFQMFFGWEGVGLCSYLLINFWYTRLQANKAAIKAIITNRIGDFGLIFAIFLIYYTFNSVNYSVIFSTISAQNHIKYFNFFGCDYSIITCICLLLFLGAVGKSAQLGLHVWLPDAMEGPTPVSALIHAATMVTAGVFLIVRCSPFYEESPLALTTLTLWGALTAFFAATIGLFQVDIKKIIAYSTCSQLGYMIFVCGLSGYSYAIFHLFNHAFFKALLFLSAGCIIHALSDEQDIRKMGGLFSTIPFVYAMVLIGSLSLMGFPFLTGYYSKDSILELAYSKFTTIGFFAFFLGSFAALFTSIYSIRMLSIVFLKKTTLSQIIYENIHEIPKYMFFALILLGYASIFVGYCFFDLFVGIGTSVWGTSIYINILHNSIFEYEYIPIFYKNFPIILSLAGGLLILNLQREFEVEYSWIRSRSLLQLAIFRFLNQAWFFDKIYVEFILNSFFFFGKKISFNFFDRGLIEFFGSFYLHKNIQKFCYILYNMQSSYFYHLVFFLFIGVICFVFLFFFFKFYIYLFIIGVLDVFLGLCSLVVIGY